MKKYFYLLIAALCTFCAFTSTALAGYHPDFGEPFDFSLLLSKNDINLQADNGKYPVSLDRVSISMFTIIEPLLQFGFITGSSNLSIENDPVTTGMSLAGYHAGLAMRSTLGSNPQIEFNANYLYQETRNETTNQKATLSWHEWGAGIAGKIILGQQLALSAGWRYNEIDARRRASGIINESQNLKLEAGSQATLGMAWHVRDGGRIGFHIQRGSYQRVEFRFSRKFR